MGTSHLKAAQLTALDTFQPVGDLQSAGAGAPSRVNSIVGIVTAVAADAAGSTYQLVRVPSFAILKSLVFMSEAQGAGKVQVSAYYSSSKIDGTTIPNQGLVVPATGVAFFSGDIDCAARVAPLNVLFNNDTNAGSNNLGNWNKRFWDALGLAADPGGFFDIVAVVHTTAITTGGGRIGLRVEFAE